MLIQAQSAEAATAIHESQTHVTHDRESFSWIHTLAEERVFRLWTEAMLRGRYDEAWAINRARERHWPSAHCLWKGEDLHGADLTIHCLHGLGDAVQMLRYMPLVSSLVKSLRFVVPSGLEPLLPYFRGLETLHQGGATRPLEALREVNLEIMELPHLFQTSFAHLPLAVAYLAAPPTPVLHIPEQHGKPGRLRIGLVWSGGDWDCDRWIPLKLLEPLILDDRYEWWNVQGGAAGEEAVFLPMVRLSPDGPESLVRLTQILAGLDLVLTIDTLAAHLAGALGVPTWLMLKHDADWRWMTKGDRSRWYPSMRLFRQPDPGHWAEVIAQVSRSLEKA